MSKHLPANFASMSRMSIGSKDTLLYPNSLANCLLQVGAKSVLVSLWKVDDKATSLLMGRFYENMAGVRDEPELGEPAERMDKEDALAEAKRWVRGYRDENGGRPYRHPAYWAGFVLLR